MGNSKKKRCHENYVDEERNYIHKDQIKQYNRFVAEYASKLKYSLMVSRFNQHTWEQNVSFRNKNKNVKCLYGTPVLVSNSVLLDSVMFIMEMDIENNCILGIGLVKNHPICGKYVVYGDNMNVNRYLYMGKTRIDRGEMDEEENEMMRFFDTICFCGSKHMKRGNGLSRFPVEILYRCSKVCDLVQYIFGMFKKRAKKE